MHEDTKKYYFTLIDFRKATNHFADPDFDGEPVQIYEPGENDPVAPPDNVLPSVDAEDPIPPKPSEEKQDARSGAWRLRRRGRPDLSDRIFRIGAHGTGHPPNDESHPFGRHSVRTSTFRRSSSVHSFFLSSLWFHCPL